MSGTVTLADTGQVTDQTTSTGTANAASVDLGNHRTNTDVFVDVSGAATLTVEVSTDGETWRQADSVSYDAAATDLQQYHFAYEHVRAHIDTALNELEVVGRGL